MAEDAPNPVLGLQDILPEDLQEELKELSPGVEWALDAMVLSFGDEIHALDATSREAFAKASLAYGRRLGALLTLAKSPRSHEQQREHDRKKKILAGIPLFATLSEFDLGEIADGFHSETIPSGMELMRQGEEGKAVYFVESGQVGVFVDGNQVAVREAGAVFGEMSCITGEQVTATIQSVSECRVLTISREEFAGGVMQLPEIIPQIAVFGMDRLIALTTRMGEVLSHMPDALLKIDPAGTISGDISKKCFEYLEQEFLAGRRFSEVFFREDLEAAAEWEKALPTIFQEEERAEHAQEFLPRETNLTMKSGEIRRFRLNFFPCREHEKITGLDLAIVDLTEQTRLERERRDIERQLQQQSVKHKFLIFRMDGEEYGVAAERVREIIGQSEVTTIPNAPDYLYGVINLRGAILPLINMGTLLGGKNPEPSSVSSTVVVEMGVGRAQVLLGFKVEEVTAILDIPSLDIEEPPKMGLGRETAFIQGIAKLDGDGEDGSVKILLDTERMLSKENLLALSTLKKGSSGRRTPGTPDPAGA